MHVPLMDMFLETTGKIVSGAPPSKPETSLFCSDERGVEFP
jgi:hypothetical protein